MSELSTADLAGGSTRPRGDAGDPARVRGFERVSESRRHPDETDEGLGMSGAPATPMDAAAVHDDRDADTDQPGTTGATPTTPSTGSTATASNQATPLFPTGDAEGFRSRWMEIQTGFVDEPRRAVEQADGLVAESMKRLAQVFADERAKLEEQWSRGDDISTEELRVALQRYRSFFDRLLSV